LIHEAIYRVVRFADLYELKTVLHLF